MNTSRHLTRRWVTPEGARLELAWLDHTPRNGGRRGIQGGGGWDGWRLTVKSPQGTVLRTIAFGREVPEADLAKALAAVNAVPVLVRHRQA